MPLDAHNTPALVELSHSKEQSTLGVLLLVRCATDLCQPDWNLSVLPSQLRSVDLELANTDIGSNLVAEKLIQAGKQFQKVLNGQSPSGELLDQSKRGPKHALLAGINTGQHDIYILVIHGVEETLDDRFGPLLCLLTADRD